MSLIVEVATRARDAVTRRRVVGLALAVAAFALLWTTLIWIVPPIVKSKGEAAAADALGRSLTLGKVAFNPWTLELTVSEVRLAAAPSASAAAPAASAASASASASAASPPPQLEIARVHADLAITSLFRLAPVVDALEIDAPLVRLTRVADGRYDIDDVLARLAARPSAPADAEPARFALHNIVVKGGGADFVDVPLRAVHRVRALELGVPFISTLPSEREVRTQPRLAFTLDGSRFDSAGAMAPFGERGNGEARLKLDGFDIGPWLGYVPSGLPVRLQSAVLDADLTLAFEQRPSLSLRIAGSAGASGLKVADAAEGELLSIGSIKVKVEELRPLERTVKLTSVEIEAPRLLASRSAAGKVNLLLEASSPSGTALPVARVPLPTTAASAADVARAAGGGKTMASSASTAASAAPAPSGWKASLAALSIHAGQLDWHDRAVSPAASLSLGEFGLEAQAIAWPLEAPVVFQGEGKLGSGSDQGKLTFSGQGNAEGARLRIGLDALPLAPLRPYLREVIALPLAGSLTAQVGAEWKAGGAAPRLRIDAARVAVSKLSLGDAGAPELSADSVELLDAKVDTVARSATLGRFLLQGPKLQVERGADRAWNVARWVVASTGSAVASRAVAVAPTSLASAVATEPASSSVASAVSSAPAPWRVSLGELAIAKGRVGFVDRGLAVPAALDLLDLDLQLKNAALDGSAAAPFNLRAHVAVPAGPSGKAAGAGVVGSVDVHGELKGMAGGVPQAANATLQLKDLPLHLVDPYLDSLFNIDIQKAQTSFRGELAWVDAAAPGAGLSLRGDATVDDFRATSFVGAASAPRAGLAMVREGAAGAPPLLNWKSLSLRGIELALEPAKPLRLKVAETALSDFFARVVLDEQGHLNLQDVARPGEVATAAASSPSASAPMAAPSSASPVVAVARAPVSAGSAASSPGLAPQIAFGPIAVVNGRVVYNDRFVKPNYTADLSQLTGRLGAFSSSPAASGPPPMAPLELRGRVEGTASLEITGQLNPLAKPLALDLKAKVRDLELPPLSPYAIKYAGYGIERGKLSVDLAYVVQPGGQLTASNRIVLNQLAFGDKVEGSTASLPVKLAVALLADRHGVIDLDLPISGSINDPQFSVGGLIWKVVTNLVVKAVTSPFSLLASALGGNGGSEASTIAFAPGAATLTPAASEQLDKIAAALKERPALTLTVSGESRLEAEREAWKQQRLLQLMRQEKRRQMIAAGVAAPDTAVLTLSDEEQPTLLKEVYRRADIVKPKNVLGMAKDLTPAEMRNLLLAAMTVDEAAMQQLAVRRAVAVRDYLASRELPTGRLFLGAPKTSGGEGEWTPRAALKLSLE